MANALTVNIKEPMAKLKALLKIQPMHLKCRVQLLIVMKKSDRPLSKNDLALQLGVNHNSIQTWRKAYIDGGISQLLEYKRTSNIKPLIDSSLKGKIAGKLNNPTQGFRSYKEMHDWIKENFLPEIHYQTVNKYVKRTFGAKLKVARKSHINKDPKAIEGFKKNSTGR